MAKPCELIEATYQGGNKPVVDREGGFIRGVKILGKVSANGREYSDKALQEAAALYENRGVNTDHPDRKNPSIERSIRDGVGWLENIQVRPGDGVYGDLGIIKSHPMAEPLFEVAERKPDRFGLSHNASGSYGDPVRGKKPVVESVNSVRSVDIVQNPATNKSLFESMDNNMPQIRTLKVLMESLPAKSKNRAGIAALLEDLPGGGMPGDMPVDMSGAMPADATAETATPDSEATMRAAFKSAVSAVMDDTTLGVPDMLMKIEAILNAQAAALGIDIEAGEAEPPPAGGDAAVTESVQEKRIADLERKLADKDADIAARELLESKSVKITPVRVSTLKAITDKAGRAELLESWAKADGPAEPVAPVRKRPVASPGVLMESGIGSENEYPRDHKSFCRAIGAKPAA